MNKLRDTLEKADLILNSIDINDLSTFLIKSGFLQTGVAHYVLVLRLIRENTRSICLQLCRQIPSRKVMPTPYTAANVV